MQVSAAHSTSHYLPVQPTPPVPPIKTKPVHPDAGAAKPKAATPPHVGKTLDIHA